MVVHGEAPHTVGLVRLQGRILLIQDLLLMSVVVLDLAQAILASICVPYVIQMITSPETVISLHLTYWPL